MTAKVRMKKLVFSVIRKIGRLFYGKNVWLISDREMFAGDNGEAFFCYLQSKPIKSYFAISKKSIDYERMSAIGEVVDYGSLFYKFLLCVVDAHISSQTLHMENHEETYQIFLQHGVTGTDISSFLNEVSHKRFYMITTGAEEKKSFEADSYTIQGKNVWLTGFPRHDLLYNNSNKKITISLTWRKYLLDMDVEELKSSRYYQAYHALLNDETLISYLEKNGYQLYLKLHPEMTRFKDVFSHHEKVKIWNTSYTNIFAESELLITDYSSIAYDFALLRKPLVYYQFDEDMFWNGKHNCTKGYFDYREDGFGEVVEEYEDLKTLIISYVENNCKIKPEYEERIDKFFEYQDGKNSERVYSNVQKLVSGL